MKILLINFTLAGIESNELAKFEEILNVSS